MNNIKTFGQNLKLIIFDLDGVLVDTKYIHRDTFIQAVLEIAHFAINPDWHDKVLCGMTSRDKLKYLIAQTIISPCLDQEILKRKDTLCQKLMQTIPPQKDKIVLLEWLKSLGYKLGCHTNCRKVNTDQILLLAAIKEYFDIIVSSDEVTKAKPDSEGYLKIINSFGFDPKEVLIVEDSPHGIKAAEGSGAYVAQVGSPTTVNKQVFKWLLSREIN